MSDEVKHNTWPLEVPLVLQSKSVNLECDLKSNTYETLKKFVGFCHLNPDDLFLCACSDDRAPSDETSS